MVKMLYSVREDPKSLYVDNPCFPDQTNVAEQPSESQLDKRRPTCKSYDQIALRVDVGP
jgi:hypothetical protein